MSIKSKAGSSNIVPVKAIFFDFDGVIVDAGSVLWTSYQKMYKEHNLRPFSDKTEFLSNMRRSIPRTFLALGLPLWKLPWLFSQIKVVLKKSYTPRIFPGVKPTLSVLEKKKTLVVVSSNLEDVVRNLLENADLGKYFANIVSSNLRSHKTRALRRALKRMNLKPSEIVFVTDTEGDVLDAVSLGIKTYGVTWGFHSPQRLLNAGATGVFSRPTELLRLGDS